MVTQLKTIINEFLKSQRNKAQKQERIKKILDSILDTEIKKHTKLAGVHKKSLVFYADSSAWLFQLNLQKNSVLEQIQKTLPDIEKIKIRLGKVNG